MDRFELALQKKYHTKSLTFLEVDKANRTIISIWVVNFPSPKKPSKIITIHYNSKVTFDGQGRFLTSIFEQFRPQSIHI